MTTAPATSGKTTYQVLRYLDRSGVATYEPVAANVEASSSAAAIRKTAQQTGTYVAIPSRSFKPTVVKVATTTTVTVGA